MATKYFCDGCDKEILRFCDNGGQQIKVTVEDTAKDLTVLAGSFHLCSPCSRSMMQNADPRKWVRCAPPKVA